MAPEYAMEGLFSGEIDVFSFGVLLLEIIGGKRNKNSIYQTKAKAFSYMHGSSGVSAKVWN
ncbi:hypothetical protein Fmac_021162 [Flemingia macrophylla]|uniref:Serine-threonine/tyrosine-protein kinase catalytic domain-containing protein n=1 Tax=Flemingia macrophylla TaxID=520843 RepID=A0ABD1LW28_9FABA